MTGPVLRDDDPIFEDVAVPLEFWKVIVFVHDETHALSVSGYILSQRGFLPHRETVFGAYETYQVPITTIEQRAGLRFGPLTAHDVFADRARRRGAAAPVARRDPLALSAMPIARRYAEARVGDELRDERIRVAIGREPEPQRARRIEGARPALDHGGDARIRFEPHEAADGGTGGALEAVEQLRRRHADAWQVDRADLLKHPGGRRPAWARFAVVTAGEETHRRVSSGTGQTLSMPARGSRTMPLTKLDIAEFGRPGRTDTVGTRQAMPSTTPRRVASRTSSSAMAFVVP